MGEKKKNSTEKLTPCLNTTLITTTPTVIETTTRSIEPFDHFIAGNAVRDAGSSVSKHAVATTTLTLFEHVVVIPSAGPRDDLSNLLWFSQSEKRKK